MVTITQARKVYDLVTEIAVDAYIKVNAPGAALLAEIEVLR